MPERKKPDPVPEVQEVGDLSFPHRPKVEQDAAASLDDVERVHLVLRPQDR